MTTRVSKFTYGVPCEIGYDPSDPEHVQRFDKSYVDEMGERCVQDAFHTMLTRVRHAVLTWCLGLDFIIMQNTKVLADHEIRHSFHVTAQGSPPRSCYAGISKYTGDLSAPEWEDVEPGRVSSSL